MYNYRHSRSRRISENLFGILTNRWRVFGGVLNLGVNKATAVTICSLLLHNCLRKGVSRNIYCPPGSADSDNGRGELTNGAWSSETTSTAFLPVQPAQGNNPTRSAKLIREVFTEYFLNEGSLEWQWEKA